MFERKVNKSPVKCQRAQPAFHLELKRWQSLEWP